MSMPRELAERIERLDLPTSGEEIFVGYGIMGQPFRSGHVLALRRFVQTSIGPGYTSVWHCDSDGRWTIWGDVPPLNACPRYFGPALMATSRRSIAIEWPDPWTIKVRIDGLLDWETTIAPTPATRMMSAICAHMPDAVWRSPTLLGAMGRIAGPILRAGALRMTGAVPSRQSFRVKIDKLWATTEVRAALRDEDIGPPGPVQPQRWLGGFAVPNRGLFAIGQAAFEPFAADRHLQMTTSGS
jgi:hypothetical protein